MFRLSLGNEMETMQHELDQIFHGLNFNHREVTRQPKLDFSINDLGDNFQVNASLPGLAIEKLNIEILGQKLTVSGQFDKTELPDGIRYQRQERQTEAFKRELRFNTDLDSKKIVAKYQQGVLQITLPKAATALPQKITVNIG